MSPQADYIVANGTGAAVRSDINGQLAAIVSNNSGATEPATMYAYQWWADTTTGLLKLRNSANSAWISLRELDGTLTIEDGTAAAPGLAFTSDLNTGLFRVGADQLAITTGGTSRLAVSTTAVSSTLAVDVPLGAVGTPSITFTGDLNTGLFSPGADTLALVTGGTNRVHVTSGGLVGINNPSPGRTLDVVGTAKFSNGTADVTIYGDLTTFGALGTNSNFPLALYTNGTEKARIDTSGRLLVGTSSERTNVYYTTVATTPSVQFESVGSFYNGLSLINYSASGYSPVLTLGLSASNTRGTNTAIASTHEMGAINFAGNDGTNFRTGASIVATNDQLSAWAVGDCPTRLVFSTTADSAASPTERMRINNTGSVTINGATSVAGGTHTIRDSGSSPDTARLYNNTDSNNTGNRFLICDAGASVLRAEIRTNGGLANYSANNANLSDRNAKKDISLAADTWGCVKEWEIVNYRYKDQPDDADLNLGVIAQQVAESCPEVITVFQEAKEATETEPAKEERLGVKEQQMYWMAIKALQEAMERIEVLETRLTAAGIA